MSYPASLLSHIASRSFYVTGGTLRRDAPSYVQREADRRLFERLMQGRFCYVLTARQMGKSSLMVQTASHLQEEGITVVALDLTAIGQNLNPEQWYGGLLSQMGQQLDLEDELLEFWRVETQLGPLQRLMQAIRDVVLARSSNPVVIFIDEIDTVRSLSFSTDEFFAGIRELYGHRAKDPEFERLSFCLLGVATPSDLIRDRRMTPFNIGERIELHDFTAVEAAPLAQGLEREGKAGTALLERVLYWTGGHPYLTQRLCQSVAEDPEARDPRSVDRLCKELFLQPRARERDDNLLFVREWLIRHEQDSAGVLDLYRRVRIGKRVADDETVPMVSTLRLSGITRVVEGHLLVRNQIYSRVFDRQWVESNLSLDERQRQREAFRRGVLRASAIIFPVMAIIIGLALFAFRERNLMREQEAANRRLLYSANMNLALQDWENGDVGRMSELLASHIPKPGQEDMRGFEWYYLWRLCHQDLATMQHSQGVNAVAYSPDAQTIASGSADGLIKVWNSQTFKEIFSLAGHSGSVLSLSFSPDGKRLATGSDDRTVRIWDTSSGRTTLTLSGLKGAVMSLSFSPDGRRLAVGIMNGGVQIWDAVIGEELWSLPLPDGERNFAVFSLDGHLLATGLRVRDGVELGSLVVVWDVDKKRRVFAVSELHRGLMCIAFSLDGKRLATSSYGTATPNSSLKIWDVGSGRELRSWNANTEQFLAIAFSPDGKTLVSGSSGHIVTLWDTTSGEQLLELKGHARQISTVAYSPEGSFIVSGSDDCSVKLWDANKTPQPKALTSHRGTVYSVAFSADGRIFGSVSADGTLMLWDARTSRQLLIVKRGEGEARVSGQVPFSFSPDGGEMVSIDYSGNAAVWDAVTGKRRLVFLGHTRKVSSAVFSPDGKVLATAGVDTTARLWDVTDGRELLTLRGHTANVRGIAFSPDGTRLATSSLDRTTRVWDVKTGAELLRMTGHADQVIGVAYSPDGSRIASGSNDGTIKIWNAFTGELIMTLKGHGDGVGRLAFSPDGRRLASGSVDRTLRLWDTATWQEVLALREHWGTVWSVAFSPDGRQLLSSSDDSTVRLREAATDAEVRSRTNGR